MMVKEKNRDLGTEDGRIVKGRGSVGSSEER